MSLGKYHDGKGYSFYCYRDTSVSGRKDRKYCIYEHRLLMYAWGELDSVFFEEDAREIHHYESPKWLNIRSNLDSFTPEGHRDIDPERAKIKTPWDRQIASD